MAMISLSPGFRALVIGASGGIGSAVHGLLANDTNCGEVVSLSRSGDGFDVTDEDSVAAAASRLEGPFHLVFTATGALTIDGQGPEKSLRQITHRAMMEQFSLNACGPALIVKHFAQKLPRKERAIMAFVSARVGSIGDNRLGGWYGYRASKAALNQIVHTAAIEIARTHPQAVLAAVHPGTVATALSENYAAGRNRMLPEQSAGMMLDVVDGLTADHSGGFLAYDGSTIAW